MNNEIFAGNWKQFKGSILEQWGKLTGDELDVSAGRRDYFIGDLQHHYGLAKEEAEIELKAFEDKVRAHSVKAS